MRVLFRSAAAGDDVAHGQQGLVQQRQGLLEVDDVHAVAGPENERGHARVPAAGGMSKVDASFEELTQRGARKRHETFSGWSTAGLSSDPKIEPQGAMILWIRSEEHTSELQSLMRISYAVFCLKKKTTN